MPRLTPVGSPWLAFLLRSVASPATHGYSRQEEGAERRCIRHICLIVGTVKALMKSLPPALQTSNSWPRPRHMVALDFSVS